MPFWQAIFESRPAVQFQHRWFAGAALIVQVVLGIVTLIHVAPLSLSLMHQAGAIILFLSSGGLAWTAARGALPVEPETTR
jgi:cytochrome c oxidase assembly protein subunit 15